MQNSLVNVQELSEQQQVLLMAQLRDEQIKRVEKSIAAVSTKVLNLEGDMNTMKHALGDAIDKIDQVVSVTDVIGFSYHSKKGSAFRGATRARCYELLGSPSSPEFVLLYGFFCKKISRDITRDLNVSRIGNIAVADFDLAMEKAHKWIPSDKYVIDTIQTLIEKRDNGYLAKEKCVALTDYLTLYHKDSNPFRHR